MTSELFIDWVRKLDNKVTNLKKKIALVIDNCPAHPSIAELKSVNFVFLPPNTTSKTQSMDQGVIRNLKVQYRKLLIQRKIRAIDLNSEFSINIHELDALRMLRRAWGLVT